MDEEIIVDRVAFDQKVLAFYNKSTNRSVWHRKDLELAIKILSEIENGVKKLTLIIIIKNITNL